jgi:hypothetical protein
MVSPRTKLLWVTFFALFPLAYAGGVMLEMAQERAARMAGAENRDAAIRTAEEFAASKGYEVATWHRYAVIETRDNLLAYYDNLLAYYSDGKQQELAEVSALAPAREVQVLFRSPDESHEFRVYLTITGQVAGYDFGKIVGA